VSGDTLIGWLATVIGMGTGGGTAVEFVDFGDGGIIEQDEMCDALAGTG